MKWALYAVAMVASIVLLVIPWVTKNLTTWPEMVAFVAGAWCVWLIVKEHIWNWPIGLINSAFSAAVFYTGQLFADAGLQIVYFILGLWGWYWWLYGGKDRTELKVTKTPLWEWIACLAAGGVATAILYPILVHFKDPAPLLDGLLSCFSLVAQYLITKKRWENWIVWIVLDAIYIPLFCSRGWWFMGLLYLIYLALAIQGLIDWWKTHKAIESGAELNPSLSG